MIVLDAAVDGGDWHPAGEVVDGASGSLSSETPTGRQVYVFGTVEGRVGLFRSAAGLDVDIGGGRWRAITTRGFELVASPDDMPYTITVWRPGGRRYEVRFRHL